MFSNSLPVTVKRVCANYTRTQAFSLRQVEAVEPCATRFQHHGRLHTEDGGSTEDASYLRAVREVQK